MPPSHLRRNACGLIRALPLAMAWLVLVASGPSSAQTLIPGDHHLRWGEPPLLTLRVRLPDGQEPAGLLPQRCLSVSLQPLDPREGPAILMEWQDAERNTDGSTWVTFTHPEPLRLLRLLLRATLHCGPSYTRLQQLQAQMADDKDMPSAAVARPATLAAPAQAEAPRSPLASLPLQVPVPVPAHRPTRPPAPPRPEPPAPPVRHLSDGPTPPATVSATATTLRDTSSAAPIASPMTDAFVQVWQQDLRQIRNDLQPMRQQLASQAQRLSAQEDLRRDALMSLLALGAGATALWMATRAWRERRLPHFRAEGLSAAIYPTTEPVHRQADEPSSAADPDWIGAPHVADVSSPPASSTTGSAHTRATLDETPHLALHNEVDALRGAGDLGAAVALLEAALDGEDEQPPGLLLRLIDLYRRLDQADPHGKASLTLARLYAVEVPEMAACVLLDEFDPDGARRELLAALPALCGRSDADTRQRLSDALLTCSASQRLVWRDFQTALAWHAALGRSGQTSTRSMPPVLASCT